MALIKHFSVIFAPRINRTKEHKVIDILVIAVVGAICGAESRDQIEFVARSKSAWRKQFLELKGGIPSHVTIGRVISRTSHNDARKGEEIMAIRTRTSSRSTQLDRDELGGLLPDYIMTQTELNDLERENILMAMACSVSSPKRDCCKVSSSTCR